MYKKINIYKMWS